MVKWWVESALDSGERSDGLNKYYLVEIEGTRYMFAQVFDCRVSSAGQLVNGTRQRAQASASRMFGAGVAAASTGARDIFKFSTSPTGECAWLISMSDNGANFSGGMLPGIGPPLYGSSQAVQAPPLPGKTDPKQ